MQVFTNWAEVNPWYAANLGLKFAKCFQVKACVTLITNCSIIINTNSNYIYIYTFVENVIIRRGRQGAIIYDV